VTRALVSDARDNDRAIEGTRGAYGGAQRPLVTGSPAVAGGTTAGLGGTAAGTGTTGHEGDTPIGDALSGDPLTTGAGPGVTGGAEDDWTATGEARR
ncbi:MAG TPA: hypothetical protein VJN29_00465, partial [Intrasporangium sp.]|uniref:hypothetical protein n=1 Tax=Intrasporangium sp. TaxID=1925024 RepID=UPI002B4A590F